MTTVNSSAVEKRRVSTPTWLLLAVVAWMTGTWYFYRGFFRSDLGVTQGDNGDGRLTEVIAGHWREPFQFAGGLTDIGIFYPFGQGLMYSDTMMLFGIITLPLVPLGIDPSVAFQISLIVASTIGFFATLAFLRLGPQSPWIIAIGASFVVAFSNGLLVASNHPQLLAVGFLPLAALLYLFAIRARNQRMGFVFACLSGLLFAATTYTTFAIGWFAVLGVAVFLIAWILLARPLSATKLLVGRHGKLVIAFVVGAVPLVLLFGFTYLPLLSQGAGRSISEVRNYALQPADLLAVSPTNVVWFRPLFHLFNGMSDTERAMAPTPLLLLSAWTLLFAALISRQRHLPWMAAGTASIVAGLTLWLLPVTWGSFFPWAALHSVVPGADAIRAIGRIELMAGLLITVGSAVVAGRLWRSKSRSTSVVVLGSSLVVVIVAEQANFLVQQNVSVEDVQALRSVPAPPLTCESFVLLPPFPADRAENGQTDAAIIAQTHGIPTWNGSSGGIPPGWSLGIMDVPADYLRAASQYELNNDIQDACQISLATKQWTLR